MAHYDRILINGMTTKEVAKLLGYKNRISVWQLVDKGMTDEEILNHKPKFRKSKEDL